MKKKNWKTTVAGILAALGTAGAAAGIVAPPWSFAFVALTVIGQALLGFWAADNGVVAVPKPLQSALPGL
jgi:hypothetical protein